ncbi:hypothetical protein P4493_04915 [Bacillus thuringiensis]|jgi:hypothetical protein|uniref:Uncharacterized protein n=3 Tax=Bacillus thuringiensis TaxID=1428 RepID=A0A0B5NCC2_BACTU|nr:MULTISPECIES: hypothetical protein [Bacillus]EAO56842.1 hypothetical protein RBTH_07572 [Bacillus thuringiensis serovar israelensis ATCC 35646]MEC2536211.1 hypothetical protein [Bacillus cereus]MED1153665.1 hypothetical protein [Bacillus paranthracis]OUB09456.1 hypothetical protein BK708_33605 [Bacillus thuringiensis serovar yunnanensis]AFQ29986.1 hypothetical protein BTF1_29427 [Bacillus thuringiensis HD-789]
MFEEEKEEEECSSDCDFEGRLTFINGCKFLSNVSDGGENRYIKVCNDLGIKYHVEAIAFDRWGRPILGRKMVGFYIDKDFKDFQLFWNKLKERKGV